MSRVLVFGASGALGSEIAKLLAAGGATVIRAGRTAKADVSTNEPNWASKLASQGKVSGVVWAQGTNSAGTILTTTAEQLSESFESNVSYIMTTLQALVEAKALANPARTVVLSSIWQEHARDKKFAYVTTKAALSGLVKSAAIDLADHGIAMNAVLPGVIDTPMTRANLSAEQIERVEASSLGGKLAKPESIASAVEWLLSEKSGGLNGQFITVDQGWTINRNV
jgi:NAD(P)-dependent dehydrogenase (short-subunit alcohol dehydrogenase family)